MSIRVDVLNLGWLVSPLHELESLCSSQETSIAEHVTAGRMQRPVVAFTGAAVSTRDLDEAVIQGEVVADGILPSLLVVSEVGEFIHDELVDLVEG